MNSLPLSILRFFAESDVADAKVALEVLALIVKGKEAGVRRPQKMASVRKIGGTIRQHALEVLTSAGEPMTGDRLTAAINDLSGTTYTKASIVGMVAAYVRKKDTFCRPEDGMYGLLDWTEGDASPGDQSDDDIPF